MTKGPICTCSLLDGLKSVDQLILVIVSCVFNNTNVTIYTRTSKKDRSTTTNTASDEREKERTEQMPAGAVGVTGDTNH